MTASDIASRTEHRIGDICFGSFTLFPVRRMLLRDGEPVAIGSRALDILIALVERPGELISNRRLLQRVWPDLIVEDSNLRAHIAGLRKALGDGEGDGRYIANVPSRGYCFVGEVRPIVRPAPYPAMSAPPAGSAPLPAQLANMVGREDDIDNIADLLDAHRFVTIAGPGGIGKTSSALAIVHERLARFGIAACFVDLTRAETPDRLPAVIAAALGLTDADQWSEERLIPQLCDQQLLLVVDNCEHLVDAAALFTEKLHAQSGNVCILATSRERLRAAGEHVYWLPPLALPEDPPAPTAERIMQASATRLFVDHAFASGHHAPISSSEAKLIADICRKLDGIPLAIECVASRVGLHGIGGTAELLDQSLPFLPHGRRNAEPRHRSLQATLDWSFGLLDPGDRIFLHKLSALRASFTLAEACDALSAPGEPTLPVVEALERLVEKSLIWTRPDGEHSAYRLPHMTRAYLLDLASQA